MKQRLLAGILTSGLLVGSVAIAQPAAQHHSTAVRSDPQRRRGSARRSVGTGALGGAAVGGLLGGRRGVLMGGAMGAGAGALHHRSRRRRFR